MFHYLLDPPVAPALLSASFALKALPSSFLFLAFLHLPLQAKLRRTAVEPGHMSRQKARDFLQEQVFSKTPGKVLGIWVT